MSASEPTLMRLVIASSTSAHHVVHAYHEAIRRLPMERFQVQHIGLPTDGWYAGNARAAYSALGCAVLDVPRPSGAATPWWQTHDIFSEFDSAVPTITESIQNLTQEQRPTLLLLADDTGPLEVLLIKLFEAASIPIVLIEHGPGFIFDQDNESRLTLNRLVRRVKSAVQQRLQPSRAMPVESSSGKNRVRENLRPKPFGHNGNYLICSYSKLSSRLLVKHGISGERIRDTGFPYYDLAVRSRRDPLQSRSSKRILIVSTGWGLFGRREAARRYYRLVIELCRRLSTRYTMVFRFKPGERPHVADDSDLVEEMGALGVQFDDGDIEFHQAIQDYDLVLGEPSGALFEAVIVRKPTVLLDYSDRLYGRRDWSFGRMLREYLELLCLRDPSQAEAIITQALTAAYAGHLTRQLRRYEEFLFNKVDGNAGLRVSQVLLETICARVEAERVRRSGSSREFISVGHPASLEKVRARYGGRPQ